MYLNGNGSIILTKKSELFKNKEFFLKRNLYKISAFHLRCLPQYKSVHNMIRSYVMKCKKKKKKYKNFFFQNAWRHGNKMETMKHQHNWM